jgi:hypothetical protein
MRILRRGSPSGGQCGVLDRDPGVSGKGGTNDMTGANDMTTETGR